ncbi:hypothetical protein, conserved, partial [Plasmodium ovale curtisi]
LNVRRHDYGFVFYNNVKIHIQSKKDMNRAMHGDSVVIKLKHVEKASKGKGDISNREICSGHDMYNSDCYIERAEGKIVYIEEHHGSNIQYVCIFRDKISNKKFNVAIPFKKNIPLIKVRNSHIDEFMKKCNVKDISNQLMYIKIFQWTVSETFPEGKIVEILGQNDIFHNMQNAILLNYNLNFNMKDALEDSYLKELKNRFVYENILREEIKRRLDLRKLCIFTIDPERARDLDDAINVNKISRKKIMRCSYYIQIIHNLMVHNGEIEEDILAKNLSLFVKDESNFFSTLKKNKYVREMEDMKYDNFVRERQRVGGAVTRKVTSTEVTTTEVTTTGVTTTGVTTTGVTTTGVTTTEVTTTEGISTGFIAEGVLKFEKTFSQENDHEQSFQMGVPKEIGAGERKRKPCGRYGYIFKQDRNKDMGSDLLGKHDLFCEKCKAYIRMDDIVSDMTEEKWKKYNLYEVGVHITDVSFFIKENSSLDIDARNRAMTIYLTHTCFPMISRILSEELCSLDPVSNRLCLSVFFYMDSAGRIDHNSFFLKESIINSKVKFTYEEVYLIVRNYIKLKKAINRVRKQVRGDAAKACYEKDSYESGEQICGLENGKVESREAESCDAESGKAESGKVESRGAESVKAECGKVESRDAESGKAECGKAECGKAESREANSHWDEICGEKNIGDEDKEKEHVSRKNSIYMRFLSMNFYKKKKEKTETVFRKKEDELKEDLKSKLEVCKNRNENGNTYNKDKGNDCDKDKCRRGEYSRLDTNIHLKRAYNFAENNKILENEEVRKRINGILKIFKNLHSKKYNVNTKEMFIIVRKLYDIHKITKRAREIRRKNGSLLFNNSKINFILSHTCNPIRIVKNEYTFANFMIEELMLSANKLVAIRQYFSKYRDISVFRSHSMHNTIDVVDIIELLKKHGINFEACNLRHILNFLDEKKKIFKKSRKNVFDIVCAYVKKKMTRAEYHTYKYIKDNNMSTYHYALSFLLYTHFTSPIRRYPDILVHRVIKKIINDEHKLREKLCTSQEIIKAAETSDSIIEKICINCNNCKSKSKKAQIDCEIAFFCLYLQKRDSPGYNRGIIMDIYKDKSSIYFKSFSFENVRRVKVRCNALCRLVPIVIPSQKFSLSNLFSFYHPFAQNLYHSGNEKHFHKMNKHHMKFLSNYVIQPNVQKQEFTLIVYNSNTKKVMLRRVYKFVVQSFRA